MKNNEFSFEDFFAAGTGNETTQDSFVISTEGYDGYADDLTASAEQAMEELDFLDSYEAVSRMNAETKIRMLQKIKNNYNSKTIGRENLGYSIESLCIEQIQSLEDAVEAPKEGEAAAEAPKETSEKKKGFFKTVFGAIAKFFKMIWKAITTAVSKFVEWIKHAFAKKQKAENTDAKTDMTNGNTAANASSSTSSDLGKAGKTLDKVKVMFDFSKSINLSGATEFITDFTKYENAVGSFFNKFDEACKKSKVGNTATTHTENEFYKFTNKEFSTIHYQAYQMLSGLGLKVSTNKVLQSGKTADAKKSMKELENSLTIGTNVDGKGNNEAIYKAVKKLFGLDQDTNFSTKSVEAKARAQKTIESLAAFEKNVFLSKCDPVQKKLTEYADNLQKSIDERLSGNKNINETTANIMLMQSALKFACKSEQYVSKLFNKVNACAVEYAK